MPIILNGTSGETFPSWTTANRPAAPNTGQTGYNTSLGVLEFYTGSAWVPAGSTVGPDGVFRQNNLTVNTSFTSNANTGLVAVGPVTLASGVSITLSANSRLVIL